MASQHCHAWSLLTISFNHCVNNHHMFLASVSSSSIPQAASNVCKSWWCLEALTGPLPSHLCKSVSSDSVKEVWLLFLLFRNQLEIASMCDWYDKVNTNSAMTNCKCDHVKTAWLKELLPMHTRSGHQGRRKNRGESNIGPGKGKVGRFFKLWNEKSCSSGKLKWRF